MIEPDFDMNGRFVGVSLVSPLSESELEAFRRAMANWKSQPIVWTHNPPEVKIVQLRGRWEPKIEDEP